MVVVVVEEVLVVSLLGCVCCIYRLYPFKKHVNVTLRAALFTHRANVQPVCDR